MSEDESDTADEPEGMLDREDLVGREAKRQRHVLKNRRCRERVVNVSQLANSMEKYVIVTPTERQVEATILAATSACVKGAIASALKVIETEERAAEAAALRHLRERQRAAQREQRERENAELRAAQRRSTPRTFNVLARDGSPSTISFELSDVKVDEFNSPEGMTNKPALKLTEEHV